MAAYDDEEDGYPPFTGHQGEEDAGVAPPYTGEADQTAEAPVYKPLAPPGSAQGSPIAPPGGDVPARRPNRYIDAYERGRASVRQARPDFSKIELDTTKEPTAVPPPKGPEQGWLKDLGDTFWHGSLGILNDTAGLAKFALPEGSALKGYADSVQASVQDHMERTVAGMSEAGQKAMHASFMNILSNDPNAPGPMDVGFARYFATTLTSVLPSLVFALVPGGIIGRAVTGIAKGAALAASREAGVVLPGALARAAGKEAIAAGAYKTGTNVANVAAQGVGWGAAGAGRAYNSLVKEISDADEKELAEGAAYRELRKDPNVSDAQARAMLIKQLAPAMVAAGGAVGAATGAVGGQVLHAGAFGTGAGASVARKALAGGLEGAGVGAAQGAGDTAIEQYGANRATGKTWDPNAIFQAGASGAAGGALLGSGAAYVHGRGDAKREAAKAAGDGSVPQDVREALGGGSPIKSSSGYESYPEMPRAPTTLGDPHMDAAVGFTPVETMGDPSMDAALTLPGPRAETGTPPGAQPAAPPSATAATVAPPSPIGAAPELAPRPGEAPPPQPAPQSQVDPTLAQQGGLQLTQPETPPSPAPAPPQAAPAATVAQQPNTPVPHPTAPPESLPKVAARTPNQIQREEGVGYNEAVRRSQGEAVKAQSKAKETPPPATQEVISKSTGDPALDVATGIEPSVETTSQKSRPADIPSAATVEAAASRDAKRVENIKSRLADPALPKGTRMALEKQLARLEPQETTQGVRENVTPQDAGPGEPTRVDTTSGDTPMRSSDPAVGDEPPPESMHAPVEAAPETPAKTSDEPTDIRGHRKAIRDAMEGAAEEVAVPLPKANKAAVLKRLMGEIDDLMQLHTNPKDLGRALESWANDSKEKIPGTDTWRSEIYDEMKDRVAGKPGDFAKEARASQLRDASGRIAPKERAGSHERGADIVAPEDAEAHTPGVEGEGVTPHREAVAEIESKATGKEVTAEQVEAHPADTTAGGEGEETSAGMVTDYSAKEKELASKSLRQLGNNLIKQALNGEKPLHQIIDRFGDHSKQPNAVYKNFEHYVEKELERITDPKTVERGQQLYLQAQDKNYRIPGLDPDKEGKPTRSQRQGWATEGGNILDDTAATRVTEVQNLLKELRDPVGLAAAKEDYERYQSRQMDKGNPQAAHRGGLSPEASKYVRDVELSPVNDEILDRLHSHNIEGRRYTLHEALRDIIDLGRGDSMRPARWLAERLLKLAPDIDIVTPERMRQNGYISDKDYNDYRFGALGGEYTRMHKADPGVITLNPHPQMQGQHVNTLLHEALHAVTARYIQHLRDTMPSHRDIKVLAAISREIARALDDPKATRTMDIATKHWLRYARSNPHELHTVMMTQPHAYAFASRHMGSAEFNNDMRGLGFPTKHGTSLWKAFSGLVRRILGRRGPISASEFTFFDHIIAPLESITERGARFNEHQANVTIRNNPHLADGIRLASRLGDAIEGTRSAVGRTQFMDAFRERGMNLINWATPDDILHDRYKGTFQTAEGNGLTKMQAAKEATENFARDFFTRHEPTQTKWNADWKATPHPDREALGQLMNDTTIANVALNGGDNSHLSTPEQRAQIAQLQARHDALPKASQDLYKRAVEFYKTQDNEMRDAHLKGILSDVFPDATQGQLDAFGKTVHSAKSADAFLKDPANHELATALGDADKTKLAKAVVKLMSVGRVRGDYFPLKRDGDYIVRYGEGESYGSERYKTLTEARERADALRKEGVAGVDNVDIKDPVALRQEIASHPAMRELMGSISDIKGIDKAHLAQIEEMAQRIILRNGTQSELARAKRRGIAGAMTDHGQVMAKDLMENRRNIGIARHGGERWAALQEMKATRDAMRTGGDPENANKVLAASRVIQEHEKRLKATTDPSGIENQLARKATAFGFVQNLMSMSHMVVNTMQANAMATSLLGGRHGAGAAALAFNRALAQGAPTMLRSGAANTFKAMRGDLHSADWNLSQVMRDRYIKSGAKAAHMNALDEAVNKANLIDYSESAQVRDTARGGASRLGGYWNNVSNFFQAGNHAMDVANKWATAKAAFDLEFRKTKDVAKSTAYAVDMVRKVMPNYNPYNRARISSGMMAPIMQFKNYGLHMYGTMGNLAREVYKNEHGGRAEALKTLGLILATHSLLAGGIGTMADPLRYGQGVLDMFTDRKKPHNWEADVMNTLTDLLGPAAGEAAGHGLPTLLGMSTFRRTGLADMLSIPPLEEYSAKGVIGALGQAAMGASGESAGNAFEGVKKLIDGLRHGGDWQEIKAGGKQFLPRPARDALKGYDLATAGMSDRVGKQIQTADKTTAWDAALQTFGIQPSSVQKVQAGRFAITSSMAETNAERASLTQRWLRAEPSDRGSIWREITAWNKDNVKAGTPIQMSQLLTQLRARQKDLASPGTFGVRVPQKQARYLANEARFAN